MLLSIRTAFHLLPRAIARQYFYVLPLSLFGAVLEAVGALLILGLIRLIAEPGAQLADSVPGAGGRLAAAGLGLQGLALLCGLFFLFKNSLRIADIWLRQRINARAYEALSVGLLERYLTAPYSLHLRRHSSQMIHTAQGRVSDMVGITLNSSLALVSESLVALAVMIVLALAAPLGALVLGAFLGGLLALLLLLTQKTHSNVGRRLHHAMTKHLRSMQQSLESVKEVKVFGRESYFVDRVREVLVEIGRVNTSRITLEHVPRLAVETLFVVALALMVVFSTGDPDQSLATTLGVVAYGALRVLPATHMAVYHANRISQAAAAVDGLQADWTPLPPPEPASSRLDFRDALQLEDVTFQYDETPSPALENITLTIRRGESIGIVGPTGAGKSTLIDLLTGLLPPNSGRMTVDGESLHANVRGWQAQLGYVPQAASLLDDTIRSNIALGVETADIDERKLERSVAKAQLGALIERLPDGLDTVVGERGVRLSGGERQRVAIARALYREPSVLIFDEATSALDNLTEQALTATLETLRGEKTLILIAHRLTTVRNCDRLFFLVNGKLAATGSYDELFASNRDFREMAETLSEQSPPAAGS